MTDALSFMASISGGNLLLRNIGTSPALNVRYKLAKLDNVELPQMEDAGPATPVGPGRAFDTRLSRSKLDDATRFRMHYQSLTGKRYESVGVILDKKLVDHLNFRRLWWASDLRLSFSRLVSRARDRYHAARWRRRDRGDAEKPRDA